MMSAFNPISLRFSRLRPVLFSLLLLVMAPWGHAAGVSCQMLSQLAPDEREALTRIGGQMAAQVVGQDIVGLKEELLPSVKGDWEGISNVIEHSGPLFQGGKLQLDSIYVMDATHLIVPTDSMFFCSNQSGSVNVTLNMHALPPGRYALVLAESVGAKWAGKVSLILAWEDGPHAGWRLGGVMVRPGVLDGHDGRWWWSHARELAKGETGKPDAWSAWYSYEVARALLLPVEFLSSPNLEKLNAEQALIPDSPAQSFPLTVSTNARDWKITGIHLDLSLMQSDLGVSYESTGIADPAAQRTEAKAVLSALLRQQPGLRDSFHGLWAYALKEGKPAPVMEVPMAQIP